MTETNVNDSHRITRAFLADEHQAQLAESAIAPMVAETRGYFTATTKAQLTSVGFPPSQRIVPTLVIPIYDVRGELATYQHRPDRPRLNKAGKAVKYETPARSRVVIDVPQAARVRLRDRSLPLFITEGSKKADSAVSAGLCCIALVGVWNWRDADGMLPDWEYVGLKGRKVYLVFDSDVMEKTEVHAALSRVRAVLEHRGADVRVVYLPAGEGGRKVGLDDYLAEGHGVDELLTHATSVLRQPELEHHKPQPPRTFAPCDLTTVLATVRRWLHLPDPTLLYAILAAYVANRFSGPPVWLLVVGPPSGGKTELLIPLLALPDVRLAATLTEGGLLSGTSNRERAPGAKGGLLREIGGFGYVVLKDFTSVIAQNRDTRGAVLAALREIYDGSWSRHVGVDGGRELRWDGKLGLIAGVTPAIDSHHTVMASLGERFVLYRLPDIDEEIVTSMALAQSDAEAHCRRQAIEEAVGGLVASLTIPATPEQLRDAEVNYLTQLARLTVRGRSAVERDAGGSREILSIPQPESPARFAQALHRLWGAALVIGLDRREAWEMARSVALSSMPALRREALEILNAEVAWLRTSRIAAALAHPTNTTLRTLEDLHAHGLVKRRAENDRQPGSGIPYEWAIEEWAAAALRAVAPDPTL